MAIDQFQFLQIDKGCELFPPEAQPPTTPTTTEYVPTEPPNRKYYTLAKTEIIYPKNVRAKVAMDFT